MTMKVLFLGKLRDLAGVSERIVESPSFPMSVSALIDLVADGNAILAEALHSRHVKMVVDHEITHEVDDISAAKEIAFMPPVSGG